MTPSAALRALGLDWGDVARMPGELLEAIRRANQDLLNSFRSHR